MKKEKVDNYTTRIIFEGSEGNPANLYFSEEQEKRIREALCSQPNIELSFNAIKKGLALLLN
jgi:hypothetical protein